MIMKKLPQSCHMLFSLSKDAAVIHTFRSRIVPGQTIVRSENCLITLASNRIFGRPLFWGVHCLPEFVVNDLCAANYFSHRCARSGSNLARRCRHHTINVRLVLRRWLFGRRRRVAIHCAQQSECQKRCACRWRRADNRQTANNKRPANIQSGTQNGAKQRTRD